MNSSSTNLSLLILLVGCSVVLVILIRSILKKIGVPSIVGFILFGFTLSVLNEQIGLLTKNAEYVFDFLAKLGITTLLFRIGLESDLMGLLQQLKRASVIWLGDVFVSGTIGFVVSYVLLGQALIPSLFVATALTATSVGISVAVWRDANALKSETGEMLIDTAELDDISGIVLMALLFTIVPILHDGKEVALLPLLSKEVAIIFAKLLLFGGLCAVFSKYVEERLTNYFEQITKPPEPMLMVAGIGFVMAALASLLGFSVAIGAFFAGVTFSRDPDAVKIDASFDAIYDFFSPFFFIGIGLHINPGVLTSAIGPGAVLVLAAILGKVIGDGVPTLIVVGSQSAILLGASMIPRAEIAMVIMQRGLNLGDWAVPATVFAAMVIVTAVTCVVSPIFVRTLLQKWQIQKK